MQRNEDAASVDRSADRSGCFRKARSACWSCRAHGFDRSGLDAHEPAACPFLGCGCCRCKPPQGIGAAASLLQDERLFRDAAGERDPEKARAEQPAETLKEQEFPSLPEGVIGGGGGEFPPKAPPPLHAAPACVLADASISPVPENLFSLEMLLAPAENVVNSMNSVFAHGSLCSVGVENGGGGDSVDANFALEMLPPTASTTLSGGISKATATPPPCSLADDVEIDVFSGASDGAVHGSLQDPPFSMLEENYPQSPDPPISKQGDGYVPVEEGSGATGNALSDMLRFFQQRCPLCGALFPLFLKTMQMDHYFAHQRQHGALVEELVKRNNASMERMGRSHAHQRLQARVPVLQKAAASFFKPRTSSVPDFSHGGLFGRWSAREAQNEWSPSRTAPARATRLSHPGEGSAPTRDVLSRHADCPPYPGQEGGTPVHDVQHPMKTSANTGECVRVFPNEAGMCSSTEDSGQSSSKGAISSDSLVSEHEETTKKPSAVSQRFYTIDLLKPQPGSSGVGPSSGKGGSSTLTGFRCRLCSARFDTGLQLTAHYCRSHGQKIQYRCCFCSARLSLWSRKFLTERKRHLNGECVAPRRKLTRK